MRIMEMLLDDGHGNVDDDDVMTASNNVTYL